MTNEQILEKQVEALEKLLQLKQAIVEELEMKVEKLEAAQNMYPGLSAPVSIPSVWTIPQNTWQCTDGNPHQYPSLWNGTYPPSCTKCGVQTSYYTGGASSTIVTTSGTGATFTTTQATQAPGAMGQGDICSNNVHALVGNATKK